MLVCRDFWQFTAFRFRNLRQTISLQPQPLSRRAWWTRRNVPERESHSFEASFAAESTYTMARTETPEQVRLWFQGAVQDLWPVAIGSLSLRKSPCIRKTT